MLVFADICAQDAVIGPCQAGFIKYYYSLEAGRCERFTYGGCQGNNNNFDNKKDCADACPVEGNIEFVHTNFNYDEI